MSTETGVNWNRTFVERYIYTQGESNVPPIYHRFMALSIIGAVLQNKVWLEFYKGSPLYPNLYIFLIGPSGIGKGRAISAGIAFLENCGLSDYCGVLGGTLTSAALIDFLAGKRGIVKQGTSRAYLVHPELASSIKWGEHSDALVKRMTDLFTADLSNYTDGTRGNKFTTAGRPCVSWIAGSTRRWLITNLKSDSMAGGFMARGLFVEVNGRPKRLFLPEYPDDYSRVTNLLQQYMVNQIYNMEGPFKMGVEATDFLKEWYMNRPQPKGEEAQASWQRHMELSLKIAMILSAGTNPTMQIQMDHLYEAINLVEEIKSTESELWDYIVAGGKVVDLDFVANKISNAGQLDHTSLLRACAGRGMNSRRMWELVSVLEQQGKVEIKRDKVPGVGRTYGRVLYLWKKEKPTLARIRLQDEWD